MRTLRRPAVSLLMIGAVVIASATPGLPAVQVPDVTPKASAKQPNAKQVAALTGLPSQCSRSGSQTVCAFGGNVSTTLTLSSGAYSIGYKLAGGKGGGPDSSGDGGKGSILSGGLGSVAGTTLHIGTGQKAGDNPDRTYGNFSGGGAGCGGGGGHCGDHGGAASIIGSNSTLLVVAAGGGGGGGDYLDSDGGRGGDGSTGGGRTGNTQGGGGGGGGARGGGGGGGGGYWAGNGGGDCTFCSGGGGQGGNDTAQNGATGSRTGGNDGDGYANVSWYRSTPTITPNITGSTIYAWQRSLNLPFSLPAGATGSVTVTDRTTGATICTATLSGASGSCSMGGSQLTSGNHTLRFSYDGDSGWTDTYTERTIYVTPDPVTVTLDKTKQGDGTYAYTAKAAHGITDGMVDGTLSLSSTPASTAFTSACKAKTSDPVGEGQRNVDLTVNCTPAMLPGTYAIKATFTPNASSAGGSADTSVTIAKYTPVVRLTLDPTVLSSYGAKTKATVTVTQPDWAQADVAGTVRVAPRSGSGPGCDGGDKTKSGQVTTYTCEFAPNAGNDIAYRATFTGNDYYADATSDDVGVTTTPATPTVKITPSKTTVTVGDPLSVTVEATDRDDNDLAVGTVKVYDGPVASDDKNLVGTIKLADHPGGDTLSVDPGADDATHVYTAKYVDPDGNYSTVTVEGTPVAVQPLRADVDVTATGDSSKATAAGIPVTVTTTITMDPADTIDADITMSPAGDCDAITRVVKGADRVLTLVCRYTEKPGTTPTYTARYTDRLVGKLSGQLKTFVVPATPTTVAAHATSVRYGRTPVLSATVTPKVDGTSVVGSVKFVENGLTVCTATVALDGDTAKASCSPTSGPHAGSHTVTATYVPDDATPALTLGSPDDSASYTVSKEPVSITLDTSRAGDELTLTAAASVDGDDTDNPVPTGDVTFGDVAASCGTVSLEDGIAECVIDTPAAGAKATLSGTYKPSDDFTAGANASRSIEYQRPSSGPCSTGFGKLWDRALKLTKGDSLDLSADGVGSLTLKVVGTPGTCDRAAALALTGGADLFSGLLSAKDVTVSATQDGGVCITKGSLGMPKIWNAGTLSVTQAICFPITDSGSIGKPTKGAVSLGTGSKGTLPLLAIPGVDGDATLTARISSTAVTVTSTVAAKSSAVPAVTVTATVGFNGDIDASVSTGPMSVLGASVRFAGTVKRTGASGALAASLTTKLDAPATPVAGLTIRDGATITLSGGTGTSPTFTVAGTVVVASGSPSEISVGIAGSFTSAEDYSLDLATTTAQTWNPVAGLKFTPNLSGTITRKSGATTFALVAQGSGGSALGDWDAGGGVTVSVARVSLGGDPKKTDAGCTQTSPLVLALSGTVKVGGLEVAAAACADLRSGGWHVAATSKTAAVGGLSLSDLVLDAEKPAGGTLSLTGSGTAALKVGTFGASTTVTISLQSGVFVIGGQIDASGLGLPSTSTYIAYASAARKGWATGLPSVGTGGIVDLPAGVSLFGSLTLPTAVATVLRKANFSLPSDATVTFAAVVPKGATGITFNAQLATPSGFPLLTLPSGATITSAGITYADKTFGLTADGTVKGQDGSFAPIHLAVTITATGDFSGSASVTELSLFGKTLDLSGSVERKGGVTTANVTGSIPGTITAGDAKLTGISVSLGTDGLKASGTVSVADTSVTFAASFSSTTAYQLTVSATVRNWSPAKDVTVNAQLTGSLTRTAAGWTYDFAAKPLSGDELVTIRPVTGVQLALRSFELSNSATPPSGCTLGAAGDTWLAVSGSLSLSLGGASGTAIGSGCFDLTKPGFVISVSIPGAEFGGSGGKVTLGNLTVKVTRSATTFEVDARARLNVDMPRGGQFSIVAVLTLGPDGFAIGGVADLSSFLGNSAAKAYLFYANAQMSVRTDDPTLGALPLKPGVTVGLALTVSDDLAKAMKHLGLNIGSGTSLAATANLDLANATIKLRVGVSFKATDIFSLSNGTYLRADSLALQMTLSPTQPSFGLQASATLHVPSTVPGGAASDIGLEGGISIGSELRAYFSIRNWNDALGIRGLRLKEFTLQGGITLTGLPLPSLAISATVDGLPTDLANLIGYQQGAPMSVTLAVGQTNLLAQIKIGTKGSSTPALVPFQAFGKADLLSVNYAELYFSPTGATVGDTVYPPGFALAFQGRVAGVDVDVDARIDPVNGTFYFKGSVGTISVGSLVIGPTTLTIDVGPSKFDMAFTGRVSIGPSTTQVGPALRFSGYLKADVTLAVGTSGIAARLNFEASVSAGAYVPHDLCFDTVFWVPCDWYWEDSDPLTIRVNNLGFAVNSSGLTVNIPNTDHSITFPWPKSATASRQRSLTGPASTGVQALDTAALGGLAPERVQNRAVTVTGQQPWQTTGSMGTGRVVGASVALTDGRVLALGGGNGSTSLRSAEIYDPKTGGWTQVAPMRTARVNPTVVRLKDGRVLVVGGATSSGRDETATAEIFDPAKGTWTRAGSMSVARQSASAAQLPDGTVLVAGGHRGGKPVTTVDRFDTRTGTWRHAAELPAPRAAAASASLANGDLLVAGGMGTRGPLRTAVVYDAQRDEWRAVASMARPRFYAAATRLRSGEVLVAGGAAEAEKYDPAKDKWASAGMPTGPALLASMVTLPDGAVLLAGGLTAKGSLSQVDRYDPVANHWTRQASLPSSRGGGSATLLPTGGVLFAGGFADGRARADAYVYTGSGSATVPSAKYRPMATSAAPDGGFWGTWTWIVLAVGLIVLLAAFFFVMAHRRRTEV